MSIGSVVLFGIISSLAATLIYNLFFRKREERLRAYISSRRTRLSRGRAVRSLVRAVNGTTAAESAIMAQTTLSLILAAFTIAALSGTLTLDSMIANLASRAEVMSQSLSIDSADSEAVGPEQEIARLEGELLRIKERLAEAQEVIALVERAERLRPWFRASGLALAVILWVWTMIIYWQPVAARHRAAALLRNRIDSLRRLANADEARALALAEYRVRDEETLRGFFDAVYKIANRNGVAELFEHIDPWAASERES